MSETWLWLHSGACPPPFNMALDDALLEAASTLGAPVLRFYAWTEPAATFGYSQHYADVAAWTALRPLIRRPTGGGLVPHDADWTYSLVFPPDHWWFRLKAVESYRTIHEWIHRAFTLAHVPTQLAPAAQKLAPGQCFSGAERFDLLRDGLKIAGAAQRRTRSGLLIQGSVQPRSCPVQRATWEQAMGEAAASSHQVQWNPWTLPASLRDRADQLSSTKYAQDSFNQRR